MTDKKIKDQDLENVAGGRSEDGKRQPENTPSPEGDVLGSSGPQAVPEKDLHSLSGGAGKQGSSFQPENNLDAGPGSSNAKTEKQALTENELTGLSGGAGKQGAGYEAENNLSGGDAPPSVTVAPESQPEGKTNILGH
ncbi:MAG: hypothetical protein ACYTGC_15740 [Planctomycetota bacterium]|jgi:hypothetical protein